MNLSEESKINILDIEEINNLYLITLKIDKNSKKILEEKDIYTRKEKNLNIAVASSISSKARVKLYKAFDEVLENKGKLLYCDTDSIFAEFKNDISNTKMGEIF
jgi:DNA polymerase elongation subunit (family B)